MGHWNSCKKILCVRADNMGDVIMSSPAMRALKETFGCSITLLTSAMGSLISSCLPFIDHTLVYDLPWVKANDYLDAPDCLQLIEMLRAEAFDGAVIFTAYSQNPLPAAMVCFLAGIPLRLAWCRENPYALLTHWLPDQEPYEKIVHQVSRDLTLVNSIGAYPVHDRLRLYVSDKEIHEMHRKLMRAGIDPMQRFMIVHTGVSEIKREYPVEHWPAVVQQLHDQLQLPVLLTGARSEIAKAENIRAQTAGEIYVVAGLFSVEEFVALVRQAALVVSVNTATVHIAAAVNTPVVVLYALTNPQHTPWRAAARVLPFAVPEYLRSKNEVVRYVSKLMHRQEVPLPTPSDIVRAAWELLRLELRTHEDARKHKE